MRPAWEPIASSALTVFKEVMSPAGRQAAPDLAAGGLTFVRSALKEYKPFTATAEIDLLTAGIKSLNEGKGLGGLESAKDGVIKALSSGLEGNPVPRGAPTLSAELEGMLGCGKNAHVPENLGDIGKILTSA